MLLLLPTLEVGDHMVIMRVSVKASGAGSQIALAAMDGSWDGSIATFVPANSANYMDEYKRMVLVMDPPGTTIMPILQVFNNQGHVAEQVFFDRLELYLVPKTENPFYDLLNGY